MGLTVISCHLAYILAIYLKPFIYGAKMIDSTRFDTSMCILGVLIENGIFIWRNHHTVLTNLRFPEFK